MECEVSETLKALREVGAPETVVVGAETDYRIVASTLRDGASDYFALPQDLAQCRDWLCDRVQLRREVERKAGTSTNLCDRYDFSGLIGNSPQLRLALERTARVIPCARSTVLLTGETGTGKELVARAIHANSPRAKGPFVEINCTTLPGNLLEAELFGYESGAFTDARVAKPGLLEMAKGGTLFLDEIGDLAVPLQAKLLRALEERHARRLGGTRDIDVDVRVIAATNVDLPSAILAGQFREDLYHRINVMSICLPPLRERSDDVLLLAEYFLDRFCREHNVRRPSMNAEFRRALREHTWPGNVRELRNAIERTILFGAGELSAAYLFPEQYVAKKIGPLPFPATLAEIEVAAARAMLALHGGNKTEAAKALGTSRKHLYALLARGDGKPDGSEKPKGDGKPDGKEKSEEGDNDER
jgi:DNA-binding NtrC family response regulator